MLNKPTTVIVIGAEGFLGKNLTKLLQKNNYNIIGIDIQPSTQNNDYVLFIQKNLIDVSEVDLHYIYNIDDYGLINVGGVSRNGAAANNPFDAAQNTISGFTKFLELLENHPPSWLLLASTREVNILLNNKEKLKGKQQLYASMKLSTELIAEAFAEHWGIPFTIARLSDIFGLGDHPSKVMHIFLNKAIKNEPLLVNLAEAEFYFTEVNEVSNQLLKSVLSMIQQNFPLKELTYIWDDDYVITLLELAWLAIELNPTSKSEIISAFINTKPNYLVYTKFKSNHQKVLSSINQSLLILNENS